MEKDNEQTDLVLSGENAVKRNKSAQTSAIQRSQAGAADYVPHISVDQARLIAEVAGSKGRHGERNALLIKFIFDGCLRVSEALAVRPVDLQKTPEGWAVRLIGKGSKPGIAAISASLAAELQSYCYRAKIGERDRIFAISRAQVFRLVTTAFDDAGIPRPSRAREHVGGVHILRHSGAIARLKETGNPKAVQDQLRHSQPRMTLRYMKTISAEESLKIQQGVELW